MALCGNFTFFPNTTERGMSSPKTKLICLATPPEMVFCKALPVFQLLSFVFLHLVCNICVHNLFPSLILQLLL